MSELIPYLNVTDARAALRWYQDALGAEVTQEPIIMPDGRIGHSELTIGGAPFMLAGAFPEVRAVAPDASGSPVTLYLAETDVDGLTRSAVDAGATLDRGPEDNPPVGRVAVFRDPFGHRWFLQQSLE